VHTSPIKAEPLPTGLQDLKFFVWRKIAVTGFVNYLTGVHGPLNFVTDMQSTQPAGRWRFGASFLVYHADTGEFKSDKDWEQFDSCVTCKGNATIDETPDGDLVCHVCKAILPRPNS
jgi:hypothetical protein